MPWTDFGREFLAECAMGTNDLTALVLEVGVGDSAAAFDPAQVDLQGASTLRKAVLGGFPTRALNQITLAAEFEGAEAVWHWREWGLFDDAGNMYVREVEDLGDKAADEPRIFYPSVRAGEV